MIKQRSSIAMAIDSKNEIYAQKLLLYAKQIANIKGLQNLGCTRIFP